MFNRIIFSLLFYLFPFIIILSQESDQKSVSITVYNADLGVIKDVREIEIKSGLSEIKLTDVAQRIDPTSVHINFNGEVLEQNYQYDLVSMDKILRKYVDRAVQLISDKGEFIEGTLLSVNGLQIVLQKKDGGLLMLPNAGKYQISVGSLPDGLITRPTLVWLVNSTGSGNQNVEVSYQTKGMNWHAEYVVVLNEDDTALDLNSWVSVENRCGATFKNAKLKLVAGDLNLIKEKAGRAGVYTDGLRVEKSMARQEQFQEKEFFEYHIYDLQRKTTLANNETKQISLFEAENVKATKKFFYRSGGGYYGKVSRKGKVSVIVAFENSEEDNLGKPMPKGKVRVYKSDGDALEFIGEDLIDHTPKKEEIKLRIGEAFDIVVEEVQTENKKISSKVNEQSYEITFKNRKKENITVEVERMLGLNWEVLNTSHDFKKKDAQNIVYQIPVNAGGETVLKFKVRYVH